MQTTRNDLDLRDDPAFQRGEWFVQRVAWVFWFLIIVAALAGLLGPGPLSSATVESADKALAVNFQRFLHYHNPTEINLQLTKRGGLQDSAEVFIDHALLDRIEVRRIEPEPVDSRISEAGVTHVFSIPPGAASGQITYWVNFEKYGKATGRMKLDGRSDVTLQQFVFP
jgi:hypothetical protein